MGGGGRGRAVRLNHPSQCCVPLTSSFRFVPLGVLLVLGTAIGCKDSSGPDPDIDDSPCVVSGTVALGATIAGSLANTDCALSTGELNDRYTFTTTQQRAVRFSQTAAAFDTYLEIFDATGFLLGANDDSAEVSGHATSTFKMILPAGTYELSPSSYLPAKTGAYSLSALAVPESENTRDLIFAMPGITTVAELAAGDWPEGGFLSEIYVVAMQAGRTYTLTVNTTAFNAYVRLTRLGSPQLLASDDNATSTNARITYTPTVSDFYAFFVSTVNTGEVGTYTLIVE